MAEIKVSVTTTTPVIPVGNAKVTISDGAGNNFTGTTNASGVCQFTSVPAARYEVTAEAFGQSNQTNVTVGAADVGFADIPLPLEVFVKTSNHDTGKETNFCSAGEVIDLEAIFNVVPAGGGAQIAAVNPANVTYAWSVNDGSLLDPPDDLDEPIVHWDTNGIAGLARATVTITENPLAAFVRPFADINVREGRLADQRRSDAINVSLRRANVDQTNGQGLWAAIRNRTQAIRFDAYRAFIDKVLCGDAALNSGIISRQKSELYTPLQSVGAYELLKTATQVFLLLESGFCSNNPDDYNLREQDQYGFRDRERETIFNPEQEARRFGQGGSIPLAEVRERLAAYLGNHRLPYIQTVLNNAFDGIEEADSIFCSGYLTARADCPPLLELIWSYWHEEAMLVQSMNALSLRFQNRRSAAARDPLAHLEIAPLFPLNNMLWGYIQNELERLSVPRRAYEYDHHYGLTLAGKAIPDFRPADTRSKFLEAFHHLLYLCTVFFKQDDDTTVIADGFPILNALKEVHLLLAEGAHNQFGDLPWTARAEMLTEQWILARPEMRQFLQGRQMVPYREAWMGQVDTMKRLQGWTDVTVTHFNELAVYGEQVLLSVRYGDWNVETDHVEAANWARYWRAEIQNYIHSYRAVTGVELRADPTVAQQRELVTALPSLLIRQRLLNGKSSPALPAPMTADQAKSFRERQAARRANSG